MQHILTVDQFTKDDLFKLAFRADQHFQCETEVRNGSLTSSNTINWSADQLSRWYPKSVKGKILANLFYEPSTRTSSSFYSAMVRLGGSVIPINNVEFSSVAKGETLEDTIRTMQCYADVIVLRHKEVGAADRAAAVAEVSIVNAGDGIGEHPTQALLDFLTILMERGWNYRRPIETVLNGLNVTMMGDLKHGRTVKSLAKLLRKYDVSINWVAPDELVIPEEFLQPNDIQTDDLSMVIEKSDVLYVTRVQKERMKRNLRNIDYSVTLEHMAQAKDNLVLMHPLPRVNELPKELDSDPRAAYFRQMKYGLFMRMAVLEHVLDD